MRKLRYLLIVTFVFLFFSGSMSLSVLNGSKQKSFPLILPELKRMEIKNQWLSWRLEHLIPELMRRENIDMWLIFSRENNEDPLFFTMVPGPRMYSPGTSILIFHDRGADQGVERLNGGWYSLGPLYKKTWSTRDKSQFENLADIIRSRNPRKIGLDISHRWPVGDGMSSALLERFKAAVGDEYASRIVSAENLCVGWLEARGPEEQRMYSHICRIAHCIIAEFFSNQVIIPDVTSTDDVVWWIRERIEHLGLETWFQPSISIKSSALEAELHAADPKIIRRGDLLHCDVGINYLGLCTDMQWLAYVCKAGEVDAPPGLNHALNQAYRVAEILMAEFRTGRSGKDIVDSAMAKAGAEGLRPSIYSHPLGVHGHGSGCTMDARDPKRTDEGNPLRWDYPLYPKTAYSIELSATVPVPEWNGQDVRIGIEEDALFTESECRFIDGHQQRLLLIK